MNDEEVSNLIWKKIGVFRVFEFLYLHDFKNCIILPMMEIKIEIQKNKASVKGPKLQL
jgi:hypothetical protein